MQTAVHQIAWGSGTLPIAALERRASPARDLVLFLHGLGCVKESFAAAWETAALESFSLLAPDLPGSGDSPATEGFPCRMEDYADAVRALLDDYDFERLHIVAHSMGGAVGLLLAERGDLALASFVNVEGNLTGDDCGMVSRRAAQTPAGPFVAEKFPRLVARAGAAADPGTRRWAEWLGRTDARAFHRAAASLVEWSDGGRLLALFAALDVPKAYVYGQASANPAVLARLDAIRRIEIADAGHFVMADQPAAFLAAVARTVAPA